MRCSVFRLNERREGIIGRAARRGGRRAAAWLSLVLFAAGAAGGIGAPTVSAATATDVQAIAQADPRVASVLAGTDYETESSSWGGTDGQSAGATIVYKWSAVHARDIADTWPLLRTGATGVPAPPFEQSEHRLRLEGLTSMRVDVLVDEARVLQIYPLAGETEYVLREETWPPFSWLPLFSAYPWVLAPVFILAAIWIISWAWRRSRAWNRRLPSMTRHDRQFIVRLSAILFLLAGIAWQIYEAVYAVQSPSVQLGGFAAGDLAALPVLLFPPALFFAALALEFSPGAHRVAWGLVAFLAAAGCIYSLATATLGTAGNLNLSYYILLGVLALVSAPRAFASSRTGWSRHGSPYYS